MPQGPGTYGKQVGRPPTKKRSGFKMKGSPFLKDIKLYEGSGNQVTVDDVSLGEVYMDEDGNKARDYSYTNKDGEEASSTLYLNKPRFGESKEGPVVPIGIDRERFYT